MQILGTYRTRKCPRPRIVRNCVKVWNTSEHTLLPILGHKLVFLTIVINTPPNDSAARPEDQGHGSLSHNNAHDCRKLLPEMNTNWIFQTTPTPLFLLYCLYTECARQLMHKADRHSPIHKPARLPSRQTMKRPSGLALRATAHRGEN